MPVLEYLPTEILRQILSCLDPFDLREISAASHFFKIIAEPYVYAVLGCHSHWLTPTLRAIATQPALARHVRGVHFGRWTNKVLNRSSSDSALFSATASQPGLSATHWRIKLRDTRSAAEPWSEVAQPWSDERPFWSEEAQALLLLHLVPNLESLSIRGSPLLSEFIENTLTIPIESLPFRSLRNIAVNEFSQCSSVSATMLLALMRFPLLREVIVDLEFVEFGTHDESVVDSITAFARQSSITHLSMHFGNISTSMLQHFLQVPRALTHFSYNDDGLRYYLHDTTPLRSALRTLSPTLQSLSLDCLLALQLGKPGEQTVGSLHDWPALTTVKCSLPALVGTRVTATSRLVDLLPMGIRELQLRRTARMSRLESDEEWTVAEMTDQLVEVLQSRELWWLTVNTEGEVYTEEGGWVNVYLEEVKERLAAAARARQVYVSVM